MTKPTGGPGGPRSPRQRGLMWLMVVLVLLGWFTLRHGWNWGGFEPGGRLDRVQLKEIQDQRAKAEARIEAWLKLAEPTENQRAEILADPAVRRQGCWLLYHRMKTPLVQAESRPSDLDLAAYRRMFELLEALAATKGVFTMPYGTPGRVVSGGLSDLMKAFDQADDLASAETVWARLKAVPPEDDYLGISRADGAFRLVRLYSRAGRPVEAEGAFEAMTEMLGQESRLNYEARAYNCLAQAWAGAGAWAEAGAGRLDLAEGHYERLKSLGRTNDLLAERVLTLQALIPIYRDRGEMEKAEARQAEADELMRDPEVERLVRSHREQPPSI